MFGKNWKLIFRNLVLKNSFAARITLYLLPVAIIFFVWRRLVGKGLRDFFFMRGGRAKKRNVPPSGLRLLTSLAPKIKLQEHSFRDTVGKMVYTVGSNFLQSGHLHLAELCFQIAIDVTGINSWQAVTYHRALGAVLFMQAKLPESHKAFKAAGLSRRVLLSSKGVSSQIRQLGSAWFVAIGHMAMLDFYLKKRLLGWTPNTTKVVVNHDLKHVPGKLVAYGFSKYGIEFIYPEDIREYYDNNRQKSEVGWDNLDDNVRHAIVDDFWEYDFPDGEILTYTHGAARIQAQWERERRPPLLSLDDGDRVTLDILLRQLQVPQGAWFVCLHVREAGFHAKWNSTYPTVRDANVEDYFAVIKTITDRGGWVLRMGDNSMKPLPPMERVVDYAHSTAKCEIGDILIAAACKLFIGTNSGYATIPGIYGVPCVLTNWVPIALPLWFGQDLMIPKMFWDTTKSEYVGFEQIFSTPLGATQNTHDFPPGIEIRNNTPEEIDEVVQEMLDRLDGVATYTAEDRELQDRYFALAIKYGSYKGSRMGREFMSKYRSLLPETFVISPQLQIAAS